MILRICEPFKYLISLNFNHLNFHGQLYGFNRAGKIFNYLLLVRFQFRIIINSRCNWINQKGHHYDQRFLN